MFGDILRAGVVSPIQVVGAVDSCPVENAKLLTADQIKKQAFDWRPEQKPHFSLCFLIFFILFPVFLLFFIDCGCSFLRFSFLRFRV